ncbi:MAG: hypothetical protein HYV02_01360 [Deltaproteobacteria bacterium]|nr:hypothetical protein [Deltaproteobacteria bacterium]
MSTLSSVVPTRTQAWGGLVVLLSGIALYKSVVILSQASCAYYEGILHRCITGVFWTGMIPLGFRIFAQWFFHLCRKKWRPLLGYSGLIGLLLLIALWLGWYDLEYCLLGYDGTGFPPDLAD